MGKVIYMEPMTREQIKLKYSLDDLYDKWLVDRFLLPNPPVFTNPQYYFKNGLMFKRWRDM